MPLDHIDSEMQFQVRPKITIKKWSVSESETTPNFRELIEQYADESAINGLPRPYGRIEVYKHIESLGIFYSSAAFFDDLLIGFVVVVSSVNPHYGVRLAVVESLFVGKQHRKTGAGLKLIRDAEKYAKDIGSPGILVSAPVGGSLAEILPSLDYTETNRVFFRSFGDV